MVAAETDQDTLVLAEPSEGLDEDLFGQIDTLPEEYSSKDRLTAAIWLISIVVTAIVAATFNTFAAIGFLIFALTIFSTMKFNKSSIFSVLFKAKKNRTKIRKRSRWIKEKTQALAKIPEPIGHKIAKFHEELDNFIKKSAEKEQPAPVQKTEAPNTEDTNSGATDISRRPAFATGLTKAATAPKPQPKVNQKNTTRKKQNKKSKTL